MSVFFKASFFCFSQLIPQSVWSIFRCIVAQIRTVGPYCVMFLMGMFYPLGQGPYFDKYIFELAAKNPASGNNLMVGSLESCAGITKVLIAFPIGYLLDMRPTARNTFAKLGLPIGCITAAISVFAILGDYITLLSLMQVAWLLRGCRRNEMERMLGE